MMHSHPGAGGRPPAPYSPLADCELLLDALCAPWDDPRPAPATLIIVAHPDDEVVGAGGRLPRLRDATVVHVTDGAPRDMRDARALGFASREDYARARREELAAALALAGLDPARARCLGVADQEASLQLAPLAGAVADLIGELRPEVVLTQPYEGGHPDHDATAVAVHTACRIVQAEALRKHLDRRTRWERLEDAKLAGVPYRPDPAPVIVEMTSYHDRGGAVATGEFLPGGGDVRTVVLDGAARDLKRRLFDCYATQRGVLQYFPIDVERFRPAPRYDFTRPPHEGTLYYERFDWGMTGERWRALARAVIGPKPPPVEIRFVGAPLESPP